MTLALLAAYGMGFISKTCIFFTGIVGASGLRSLYCFRIDFYDRSFHHLVPFLITSGLKLV